MQNQKKVAAIHDISCMGRCSLTVALPIISAAGIETSIIPTAVLSTHTGGFSNYTFRDLTSDIIPIAKHWQTLDTKFDAIYTGFLGSFEQIKIIGEVFEMYNDTNTIKLVDPVMADNGELYSLFNKDFVKGMAKLCSKADIIIPNITEASFLLGEEYKDGVQTREHIEKILKNLINLGAKKAVLTGVSFEDGLLGAAIIANNEINYYFRERIPGCFHGTGDVFGSALLSALMHENSLEDATKIAVDFTYGCIERTKNEKKDVKFGVNFESELPKLMRLLNII